MENDLLFVTDEKGNKYVVSQEIKEGDNIYYLTKEGLFEKEADGKYKLASAEMNEKYMPLLKEQKIDEYIIARKDEELER